jgi:iron complex outermembrane receptor protein
MTIQNIGSRAAILAFAGVAFAVTSVPALADIEEIVVSARKRDERAQDVPISIAAFSGDQLSERGATDLYAVTQFTPGFSFERANRYGAQGGANRPVIRGMSNIIGEANASMFVDGILYSDNILSFPMDLVERIEVIKGPQAALFGRATFSGAINFITKKGSNEPENKVSVRMAEYDDYEASLLSRGAIIEDKLFYMAHARYYSFGGMYRNTLDGRHIGDEESVNFNGSLEYRPTDNFRAVLAAGITRDRDGHPAQALQDRFYNNCHLDAPRQYYCGGVKEFDSATLDIDGLNGKDGLKRDSTRLSAQLTWDLPRGFTLVSNSGAFFTEQYFGYDSTYQGATAIDPIGVPGAPGYTRLPSDGVRNGNVMRYEITDRDEWSTELRLQSDPAERFRYMIGAFYYASDRTYVEEHYLPTAPAIDNGLSKVRNVALFTSVGFDITDNWEVTGELRYSEEEISNYKPAQGEIGNTFYSVSPRITTTYKLTPDNMIYANVAKGNKPGVINADPRFPAEFQFADEEESWNYEVGTKNSFWNGMLSTNLAVYYIDWSDQQLTTTYYFPEPIGGSKNYITNAGKTEIKGVELEVEARLTDNFTTGATYAFTDAKFKEYNDTEAAQLFGDPSLKGKKLPGVPEQQASLYGKYTFPVGLNRGYVRADVSYTDRKYAQVYQLAHTGEQILANLSIGLELEKWDLTFFVKNLTDDRTPSSVTRYLDQLNLNVPEYVNQNPAQANVPGSTITERGFVVPLAQKRQIGISASYRF